MKQSESITKLATAMIKAQTEITNLYPSSKGYGYDYVPLEKIIDMLKAVLPKFGLGYIQLPITGQNGMVGLTTRIIHESGEWLEEVAEFPLTDMKGVNKTQAGGATITYLRRYALVSAFGITGDKDVDANDKAFTKAEQNTMKGGSATAEEKAELTSLFSATLQNGAKVFTDEEIRRFSAMRTEKTAGELIELVKSELRKRCANE